MSPLPSDLKCVLRCPRCRGELEEEKGGRSLFCHKCQLRYPVADGVPIMVVEEAVPTGVGVSPSIQQSTFRVIAGPDAGLEFRIEAGTCRAIGRASSDAQKTSMFNLDLSLALDEGAKALILRYIRRQFGTSAAGGQLGDFRRSADIILSDPTLSRLHAMIFAGRDKIGVLDLVSKNGTFVNGQEVESCFLRPGDVIEFGDTKLLYEG